MCRILLHIIFTTTIRRLSPLCKISPPPAVENPCAVLQSSGSSK
ncbi:hypothetical protein OROGR_002664 [Orobanche gracilis]